MDQFKELDFKMRWAMQIKAIDMADALAGTQE
jgi:hypothetical protein